jgi:hypothetical protein
MTINAVTLDEINYITMQVTEGGQLIGWEYVPDGGQYCWSFRRDISEFYNATLVTTTLEIRGLPDGSSAALIRWNNVPMTDQELDKIEQDEGRILNGIPNSNVPDEGMSLVDCRYAALRNQGYDGHVNDMEMLWLVANGADPAIGSLMDRWRSMLLSQGFTPELDYAFNDAWYALLGDQGYTGHMNDRETAFWCAGGIIV